MNGDNLLDDFLDKLIEQAGIEAADEMGRSYAEPEHQHVFSKRHEANMRKIFRRERNKLLFKRIIRYSKRIAVIIVTIAIISGVTVFSVQAWRVKFLNFIMDITQVDTNINFVDEKYSADSYSNDYISLDYIPEGFKLESSEGKEQLLTLTFKKDNQYFRCSFNEIGSSVSIDTENANIKKITINGMEAVYSSNSNLNILVWHDENYVYRLTGNLDEEEIIRIAENIKK